MKKIPIKRNKLSAEIVCRMQQCGEEGHPLLKHPVLQRIYAARGISAPEELDYGLERLCSYHTMKDIDQAAECLFEAMQKQWRIMIVGDFDVDGATSTALAMLALKAFGHTEVSYLIPNRFEYGYGLTPKIIELAAAQKLPPQLILTVDNGISSSDAVLAAAQRNIKVLVTDHHLPPSNEPIPSAVAIVNPNQADDAFPSKHLAGVGVVFYLLLALRALLKKQDWFAAQKIPIPNLAQFLDLVALGTVADMVPLDYNNRILVHQGLERIRKGKCCLGIKTLLQVAGRSYEKIKAEDLAYVLAPRFNAAGRLDDMTVGVACLLSDNLQHARLLARELHDLNNDRRSIEVNMQQQALQVLTKMQLSGKELPQALCFFDDSWHQGVIGILASKIKERFHRPTIAFAITGEGELKGSARSIVGLSMCEIFDAIAKKYPGLIIKSGGHAMAAGLSIRRGDYEKFNAAFIEEVEFCQKNRETEPCIYTDGELEQDYLTVEMAELLQKAGPWGREFPEPAFDGVFELAAQRIVGERHLKMVLRAIDTKQEIDAIHFNADIKTWDRFRTNKVHAVYRLDVNEFNGRRNLQLRVDHLAAAESAN